MARRTALAVSAAFLIARVAAVDQGVTCYNTAGDLKSYGTYIYQTQSACQSTCTKAGKAVWAATKGNTCYCGNSMPTSGVEDYTTNCNIPCLAWPQQMCGGLTAFTFGTTGVTGVSDDNSSSSDSSDSSSTSSSSSDESSSSVKATTTSAPSVVATTVFAGSTITTTASTHTSAASSSASPVKDTADNKKSTSSAGVAAGAVVGVIAVIAGGLGLWLYIRRQRRLRAEDEYRAAVSAKEFAASAKKPVLDHRLDPAMLQQRRLSDGSIADNQDYSRRILKVTNPDGN